MCANSVAQCLYVLTEDNQPAVEEIRTNSTYLACLLAAARASSTESGSPKKEKAKVKEEEKDGKEFAEERAVSIKILCSGQ